jgi:predicted ArsR family transcriptional regulator
MWSVYNENPTREKIILLLKRRGPLSIDDLSSELNITSMGIRQHLLSLEKKGLIDYIAKRQGIGRPAFLYRLTEKSEAMFPKAYDKFIIDLFMDIENHEGEDKISEIFKWYRIRFIKEAKDYIGYRKGQDKLHGMKDYLESQGYYAEISDLNNHYDLRLHNCPISRLATAYHEACRSHLQIFREVFGREVNREECIIEGHISCTYIIPKGILRN